MKKKTLIQSVIITLVLVAGFMMMSSSAPVKEAKDCKDSPSLCCSKQKKKDSNPGGLIWDNLSHQFFSFAAITN